VKSKVSYSDLGLGLFILTVGAMLIVPLPTYLLDLLIVVNLAVSLLLLLAGLYLPHALALLSFPSLLLLTTLFRLGLNVASTRLILIQADAGEVIEAFGQYLVQGEVVIGLIIFFILSAVNFVVVSKGAARVSEVAARFTLDSLPGRQNSIDSDLRSGLISAEDAQRQRENLSKESQLYGAMDGAMKFVQGDAIVGLIVIFVNLLGGLYIGIASGMSISEAIETYSVLTIGDGLVNQVPAILIAICAGLVVTRVAQADGVSLADDVRNQVFSNPGGLFFAAFVLVFFASLEGIPAMPFVIVAALLLIYGLMLKRGDKRARFGMGRTAAGSFARLGSSTVGQIGFGSEDKNALVLSVDQQKLFSRWHQVGEDFAAWWETARYQLSPFFGLPLPPVRVLPSLDMSSGEFEFRVNGTKIFHSKIECMGSMLELSPDCCSLFGIKAKFDGEHPLFRKQVVWADLKPAQQRFLQIADISIYNEFQVIAAHLIAFSRANPEEFYSVADLLQLEAKLERSKPGLLSSALVKQFFSTSRITEVAYELARQGLILPDYQTLVELLSQYAATVGASLVNEGEFDLIDIVSFIRLVRSRQMFAHSASFRGRLAVIGVSPEIDTKIAELARVKNMDKGEADFVKGLKAKLDLCVRACEGEPLLKVRDDLRFRYQTLINNCRLPLRVVSSEELDKVKAAEVFSVWQVL
jgi:type III secretory pathway component EscV